MKDRNKALAMQVKELTEFKTSTEWISTIFDLQNMIIQSGALEGHTKFGFEKLADDFAQLKNFFVNLDKAGKK